MRPSTSCTSAVLLLLASTLVAPTAVGQTPQPPAAPPQGQPAPAAETAAPATPAPPAAKPAPQPEPKAAQKTPGTEATVAPLKTLEGAMGKAVRSRTGNEDMGHIVDVLVDDAGETRAAVIDFGGFLGVGSRKVAVAWKTLDFAESIQSGSVKVNLTRDQVRQAPEYKPDEPIVILEGAATPKPAAPPAPSGHNQDSPAR